MTIRPVRDRQPLERKTDATSLVKNKLSHQRAHCGRTVVKYRVWFFGAAASEFSRRARCRDRVCIYPDNDSNRYQAKLRAPCAQAIRFRDLN